MSLLLWRILLLGLTVHECVNSACYDKWEGKWPHCNTACSNCKCFKSFSVSNAQETCNNDQHCIGFSWDNGGGCYKDERYCVNEGIGSGAHDYYSKCSKSAL
eukprot:99458_1